MYISSAFLSFLRKFLSNKILISSVKQNENLQHLFLQQITHHHHHYIQERAVHPPYTFLLALSTFLPFLP